MRPCAPGRGWSSSKTSRAMPWTGSTRTTCSTLGETITTCGALVFRRRFRRKRPTLVGLPRRGSRLTRSLLPMQDLIAKANTLLEALPYIQKFSGATFVIKYGGSFMDSPDPEVRNSVARDLVFLEAVEINPVVVHGGGKAITRAMEKAGLKANFIQGQRVTDEATVTIADDVLSREINPEVVAAINSLGGLAQGFAGPDIFQCRRAHLKGPDGQALDLGYVGEVIGVNVAPLLA